MRFTFFSLLLSLVLVSALPLPMSPQAPSHQLAKRLSIAQLEKSVEVASTARTVAGLSHEQTMVASKSAIKASKESIKGAGTTVSAKQLSEHETLIEAHKNIKFVSESKKYQAKYDLVKARHDLKIAQNHNSMNQKLVNFKGWHSQKLKDSKSFETRRLEQLQQELSKEMKVKNEKSLSDVKRMKEAQDKHLATKPTSEVTGTGATGESAAPLATHAHTAGPDAAPGSAASTHTQTTGTGTDAAPETQIIHEVAPPMFTTSEKIILGATLGVGGLVLLNNDSN